MRHPSVELPSLMPDVRLQQASVGWQSPNPQFAGAWKHLWVLVRHGFYHTTTTGMQFVHEAGLQTLLGTVLVGVVALLGGVRLAREERVEGSRHAGPIEFMVMQGNKVKLVIEAKKAIDKEKYAVQVEQVVEEMWAAREQNGEDGGSVWGMLVDPWGAVMFEARADKVLCSEYMVLFQGMKAPGVDLARWMCAVLGAGWDECRSWPESKWDERLQACQSAMDEGMRKFETMMSANMG